MEQTSAMKKASVKSFMKKNISFAAFIILFVFFAITAQGKFLSGDNLLTIVGSSMDLLIIALGATFIILMGSIDLSCGSILSLCGVIAAMTLQATNNTVVAILAAIGISLVCYFVMGFAFTKMKVPSFIATLGMLSIARAVVTMISGGTVIMIPFESPFKQYIGLQPWLVIIGIAAFVIVLIIERYTLFGRYTRLIGGDETVAKLSGIKVDKHKMMVFLFAGVMTALGGVVMASRIGSGSPAVGQGYELNVISAVVLGGTSQQGGIGGVKGTIIGALTLGMLANGLVLLGMPSEVQMLVKGAVLILAVFISMERTPNMVIR